MVNVNLLPWRDYEFEYQKQSLYRISLLAIGFAAFIIFSIHTIISRQELAAQNRVALANQKLNDYHKKDQITVKPLLLTQNRFSEKIFVESKQMNQAKVCFSEIEKTNKTYSFTGKAHSLIGLTEFLRQWDAAYLFSEIQIKVIEQQKNGLVKFGFQARGV